MVLAIWIGFGIVTAIAAQARGRSFFGWLVIGLLTGVFGLIAVLVMERGDSGPALAAAAPNGGTAALPPASAPAPAPAPPRRTGRDAAPKPTVEVEGAGDFVTEVIVARPYQAALDGICGGRRSGGHERVFLGALACEDGNAYDDQAVGLWISGKKVGRLAPEDARKFRQDLADHGHAGAVASVRARITGGDRDGDGDYAVVLDLDFPTGFAR